MASGDTDNRRRLPQDKIERIERHLTASGLFPRQLTDAEIERHYSESAVAVAWRINLGDQHEVDVLLSADYPYQRPQIGVGPLRHDRPLSQVFVDNTLCLMNGNEAHALNDDERVLDEFLRRTRELLARKPDDDRARNTEEIVDYWKGSRSTRKIVSIIDVDTKPREVFYSSDPPFTVIGDSREAVESWVRNHSTREATVKRAIFVTADVGFPTAIADGHALFDYFERNHVEQIALLESLAMGDPIAAPLLIGIVDAAGGIALLGCWICRAKSNKVGKPRPLTTPGFRPGKAFGHVAAPYFFSAESFVERARVERADAAWLTARGGDGSDESIRAARVIVLGCGSLGSSVARLLAKAGVSQLLLIDPDRLTWANISRHELGARYVGRSKARALAESITRDFPHVRTIPYVEPWQEAYARDPDAFLNATLILSTMGDPASDVQLSDTSVTSEFPPLIFAWLEPFAAAAQVLIMVGEGCLRCGCDEYGIFQKRVTGWKGTTEKFEPGCSVSWQPYSEIAATPAKSFVADIVLNTIKIKPERSTLYTWIGHENLRIAHSGNLRGDWLDQHGEPPASGTTYTDPWTSCAVCRKRAA